jgi:phosphoglucomutase
LISHDNRYLSRQFTLESARLFNEMGIKAYIFDSLRPTPELSYAVRYTHAVGGIMITASHNPKEYNGYKVYDENGCQLVPDKIARLLEIIASLPDELAVEVVKSPFPGETITLDDALDDAYVSEVEGVQINPNLNKKGFKIIYTPQHGTSYENAMRVFKDCGYQVIPVTKQCTHDPAFSGTLSPNPETAEAFIEPIKLAQQMRANLIVMTDPDGDRCGVGYLSSKGTYERFTGNQSAALLMDYIFSERKRMGTLSEKRRDVRHDREQRPRPQNRPWLWPRGGKLLDGFQIHRRSNRPL